MSGDEDIEQELESIKQILSSYIETTLDNEDQRRAENIQVLVALGVLGGMISLYVQGEIQGALLQTFFWIIGGASVVFLLIKILIPPVRLEFDSGRLALLDNRIMPFSYAFFVLLSVVVGIVILARRTILPIDTPTWQASSSIVAALLSLVSGFVAYAYSSRYQSAEREREEKKQRIRNEIGGIRKGDMFESILDSPQLLGHNIKVDSVKRNSSLPFEIDALAEDQSDRSVLIEVKGHEANSGDVAMLKEKVDDFIHMYAPDNRPRAILVAPSFSEAAQERIEQYPSIESVEMTLTDNI